MKNELPLYLPLPKQSEITHQFWTNEHGYLSIRTLTVYDHTILKIMHDDMNHLAKTAYTYSNYYYWLGEIHRTHGR